MAYSLLLQALPHGTSSQSAISALPGPSGLFTPAVAPVIHTSTQSYENIHSLNQHDYPKVWFWDKSSFSDALGRTVMIFGSLLTPTKTETTDYLEDKDGIGLTEK